MKHLLFIRHAKSSWEVATTDFERPLNDRGKKDAPAMAERMLKRDIRIETFISSPARRASTTAALFATKYGFARDIIRHVPDLYDARPVDFNKAIEEIDDQYNSAAIFSHNPGITEMVNKLTNVKVDDMPTCSIFAVKIRTDHWKDFAGAEKEFLFFDYPKKPDY